MAPSKSCSYPGRIALSILFQPTKLAGLPTPLSLVVFQSIHRVLSLPFAYAEGLGSSAPEYIMH
jgi:hypothetical protein